MMMLRKILYKYRIIKSKYQNKSVDDMNQIYNCIHFLFFFIYHIKKQGTKLSRFTWEVIDLKVSSILFSVEFAYDCIVENLKV